MKIIFAGHRGFGAKQIQQQRKKDQQFPENSLISFQKVMESGAECIEFDLYLSKDNKLMVIHDRELAVNAKYIIQNFDIEKGYKGNVGDRIELSIGKGFYVDAYTKIELQTLFDISQGHRQVK